MEGGKGGLREVRGLRGAGRCRREEEEEKRGRGEVGRDEVL